MVKELPSVISVSRRTDIPAFYPGWMRESLEAGEARFIPPRGGWRTVSLLPEEVHSLVLWSKDFGPLLADEHLLGLLDRYGLFFHLTLTGLAGTRWEPRTPEVSAVLKQASCLAERWGSERINWRFDPLAHWWEDGRIRTNAGSFEALAVQLASYGIRSCTVSFAQWYGKAVRRTGRAGVEWIDPSPSERLDILGRLSEAAEALGMRIQACAHEGELPPGVTRGRCIDGSLLSSLHPQGRACAGGKDRTQRPACGCTPSVDIGSYRLSCGHGCLYCYANPSEQPIALASSFRKR